MLLKLMTSKYDNLWKCPVFLPIVRIIMNTVFLLIEPAGSSFFGGFKIRVILEVGLFYEVYFRFRKLKFGLYWKTGSIRSRVQLEEIRYSMY